MNSFKKLPLSATRGVSKSLRQRKKVPPIKRWKIVRGDEVEVISGTDKGKQGTILKMLRKTNQVIVSNCKMNTQFVRVGDQPGPGTQVRVELPIHYSNVALLCPETGETTRVAYRFNEDGKKIRVSKKSGVEIPKSDILKQREPRAVLGPLDTPVDVVLAKTFTGLNLYGCVSSQHNADR